MKARFAVVAVLSVTALATAACQGGPAAKAGQASVTLRFATVDVDINNNGQMNALTDFVRQVSIVSGGRLHIHVDTNVGNGAPGAEPALLKAIRKGTYDGGWNATRAFASAGFPAFEATEAPFVIQSYAVEQKYVTSAAAARMMRRLDGTGLKALGLVAGPLRRPFAVAHPLLQPSDWQGISFRVNDSPVQEATVVALHGRPLVTGAAGVDPAVHGAADGQEFDVFQYDRDGFANLEPYVTANLALWPKMYAIVMNAQRFATLTTRQRLWVNAAAQRAVHESATNPFNEDPAVQRLCLTGVRFADVTAGQLAELRAAAAPVYDQLRADPTTAADLAALQAMAAAEPAASTATVPAGCRGKAPGTATVDATVKTRPAVPDGTYRVRFTAADLERYGAEAQLAASNAGIATMILRHGTYAARIVFGNDPKVYVVEAGSIRGTADTIVFIPDHHMMAQLGACSTGCDLPPPYSYRYTYSRDRLQLTVGAGMSDPISLGTFTSHPWLKVG
jgi:TRAP-type transport system periplasmic protein